MPKGKAGFFVTWWRVYKTKGRQIWIFFLVSLVPQWHVLRAIRVYTPWNFFEFLSGVKSHVGNGFPHGDMFRFHNIYIHYLIESGK
jgi:hypothetical protein